MYIIGYFVLKAGFNPAGGDTLTAGMGFQDIFVAKYDPNGNYIWAINMGGSKMNYGMDIAVSTKGNVYVTGAFNGTTDFDPGKDTAALTAQPGGFFGGDLDIFMAKYDSSGNYIWAKSMGANNADDYGCGIAVDSAENVYLTGYFGNIAEFNPGSGSNYLRSMSGTGIAHDAFIAKYDVNGDYEWATSIGGEADDNGLGIALDQMSNVYVTGYFSDTAIFDPFGAATDTLISAGRKYPDVSFSDYDMFIAKYNTQGNYIWSRTLGSKFEDIGYAIATDRVGNVFVTGTFSDTAILSPWGAATDTLISLGGKTYSDASRDGFIVKYAPNGNRMWSSSIGKHYSNTYSLGITCDEKGNTYVAGQFNDTADLDPGDKTVDFVSAGSSDVFLLKLACSDTSSSHVAVTTCEDNYTWNGTVYTTDGVYTQTFPNTAGCDSTATLDLMFSHITKPVITTDKFILGVTGGSYTTYQWIKDSAPIPGATGDAYTVTANGDYQVAVTNSNGCKDTSDVYTIRNYTGIEGANTSANAIAIYPNPVNDILNIKAPFKVNAAIISIEGRVLKRENNVRRLSVKGLSSGMYFLQVSDQDGRVLKTEKVVKH